MMVRAMRRISAAWPTASLSVHVDDFAHDFVATSRRECVRGFAAVGQMLTREIQEGLELPFAPSKSVLMGNDMLAIKPAQRHVGAVAGVAHKSVRRLGYDLSVCMRYKSTAVRNNRTKQARKRAARAKNIFGKSPHRKLFVAGVQPQATFGSEASLWPVSAVRALRVDGLKAVCHFVPGTSLDLAWLLEPKGHDPGFALLIAPVLRWAKEWWLATTPQLSSTAHLSPPTLVNAYQVAKDEYDLVVAADLSLAELAVFPVSRLASDPITAAIHSCRMLGWDLSSTQTVTDHAGNQTNLACGSPALIRHMALARYEEVLHIRVAQAAQVEVGSFSMFVARRVLCSARLSAQEARCLRQCLLSGLFTRVRANQFGYGICPNCPLCGVPDTSHHRIWICPYARHVRDDVFGADIIARAANTVTYEFARSWLAPLIGFSKHDGERFYYFNDGQRVDEEHFKGFEAGLPFYQDGSCLASSHPLLASAGSATCQLRQDGSRGAGICCSLGHDLPQLASLAEHHAMLMTSCNALDRDSRVVVDCSSCSCVACQRS